MTGKNVGRMLSITLLVVSLVLAGGAWAAQGTPSQPVADPQQAIEALAEYLGVSPEEIQALYDSGIGLGVIAEAYILSDVLLMTPEEIIEAKTSGEINWGELLQEAGLQPGEIKLRLGDMISGASQGLGAGAGGPAAQGEQYQNQEQTQNQQQGQPELPQAEGDPAALIATLAEYLGVPTEEIQALYDSGVGLGVIAEAYILSDVLLMTPEEIIEAKTSGEINWGELLQEAGLQPGEIKLRLGEIISGARQGLGAGAGDPAAQGEQYQNQEQTQNQEQAQQQQQTQNQNGDQDGSGGQGDNGNSGGSQGGGGGSGGGQGGNGGSGGSQGGGGGSGGGKGK